jgi:hypothetical protein
MTRVRIAAGEQFDTATPDDVKALGDRLDRRFAELVRENLRGVKLMRVPTLTTVAASTSTIQIPQASSGYGLAGPESGFIWRVGRITVVSNGADNAGESNPSVSQPAVPASGVAQQNTNAFPVKVVISGGTATATTVNGITVGGGDGTYTVPAYGSIAITYSVAPTWVWSSAGIVSSPGTGVALYTTSDEQTNVRNLIDSNQQCGVGYYPSSRGVFLMPGEGIIAQIANPVQGNAYTLTGQVFSVPAEMMGKLQ